QGLPAGGRPPRAATGPDRLSLLERLGHQRRCDLRPARRLGEPPVHAAGAPARRRRARARRSVATARRARALRAARRRALAAARGAAMTTMMHARDQLPTVADVKAATARRCGVAVRTPLLESEALSQRAGGRVLL